MLARLEAAGIPRAGITILIATGLHRPATEAEFREICGEETAASYRVRQPPRAGTRRTSSHSAQTATGTPVYIDDRFISADLHITLGFIEPHLMLGYSGGRKLIAPGLAAQETIKVLHSPKFMRDPRASEGSIEDNPLHRELLEIAAMARHDFLVDVALGRGTPRRPIAAVFAGDPVAAHRRGVEFVSRVMLETLDQPVDAVITTAAGYPLDLTFYQAIKGITAASHIVKEGGKILLLASCDEGVGGPEFARMLAEGSPDQGLYEENRECPGGRRPMATGKTRPRDHPSGSACITYPVCRASSTPLFGEPATRAPTKPFVPSLATLKPSARVAVIPEGPYVLAQSAALENAMR